MMRLIFPPKTHPEDMNPAAAAFARLLLAFGMAALLWSGYQLLTWRRTFDYVQTTGQLETGALRYVVNDVGNVSYSYEVNGHTYVSQNIAVGGRPLGRVPSDGEVVVFYDPENPARSVLERRPAESVILALLYGVLSPFAARFVWTRYA